MNRTKIEWCDYERGWIEALIDGEGSLSLIREKREHFKSGYAYKPTLNIGNKCYALLEKARLIIGAGAIRPKNDGELHQLQVSANALRGLLPKISLIVKEKQKLLLLEALEILARHKGRSRPVLDSEIERLEQIYQEIRDLNGRVWNK